MHKRELPGWCQILDELTSETAKESSNDQEELGRERIIKKGQDDKGGANPQLAGKNVRTRHRCEHQTKKGGAQGLRRKTILKTSRKTVILISQSNIQNELNLLRELYIASAQGCLSMIQNCIREYQKYQGFN